jgi:aspartate aminotransferase-like enzyme
MENVFARHHRCAERCRNGIRALGLQLFADPAHTSDTVTSVVAPPDLDVGKLLAVLRSDGVVLSGGQGSLAGKIFRVGHLGYIDEGDVDEVLGALAKALPLSRLAGSAGRGG